MGISVNEYIYNSPGPATSQHNDDEISNQVFEFLPRTPCRILEMGCGNGFFAAQMAERGHKVTACDESPSGIAVARRHYGTAVHFEEVSCYTPIAKNAEKFDVVIAKEVIEHLAAPRVLFENAFRALEPGGHFVVTTPYHGYLKNFLIALLGKWDSHHDVKWEGGHIKFFSPATLTSMLNAAGFTDCEYKFAGRAFFLWKSMICRAIKPVQ